MAKLGIDQEALIEQFSQASARQGEALTRSVTDVTLRALQARELTLANIKSTLKKVTEAASTGAARNVGSPVDVEAMLGQAFSGMDAALLQAVEANRKALAQFVDQGVELKDKRLAGAMSELEKLEDTFFATVSKAASSAGPLSEPWQHVLDAMKLKGTDTGAQASQAIQGLMSQTHTALRESRAASLKAAQAMMDSYSALVSGVLIGMSQGLRQGGTADATAAGAAAGGSDAGDAAEAEPDQPAATAAPAQVEAPVQAATTRPRRR